MVEFEQCISAIQRGRVRFSKESQMQEDVRNLLSVAEIPFAEEVRLSARDRIDFAAGDAKTVGIELKVAGTFPTVARQLLRYCEHESIGAVILVTSVPSHRRLNAMPNGRGIPVRVLFMAFNGI